MESTLVLNANTEPLNIVSARRAIELVLNGKAVSVDDSTKVFRSETMVLPVPYVVQRLTQVKTDTHNRWGRQVFSKRGMMVRDNFRCVYCNKPGDTIDHVIPQHAGGETSYENCVTSCRSCNGKKGPRALDQIGWKVPPLEARSVPSPYYHLILKAKRRNTPQWEAWLPHVEMWSGSKKMMFV